MASTPLVLVALLADGVAVYDRSTPSVDVWALDGQPHARIPLTGYVPDLEAMLKRAGLAEPLDGPLAGPLPPHQQAAQDGTLLTQHGLVTPDGEPLVTDYRLADCRLEARGQRLLCQAVIHDPRGIAPSVVLDREQLGAWELAGDEALAIGPGGWVLERRDDRGCGLLEADGVFHPLVEEARCMGAALDEERVAVALQDQLLILDRAGDGRVEIPLFPRGLLRVPAPADALLFNGKTSWLVDAASGDILARYAAEAAVETAPDGDILIFGAREERAKRPPPQGRMTLIDLDTWAFQVERRTVWIFRGEGRAGPVVAGVQAFHCADGRLLGLDLDTGRPRWALPVGAAHVAMRAFGETLRVWGKVDGARRTWLVDAARGKQLAELEGRPVDKVSDDVGVVVVQSGAGKTVLDRQDGRVLVRMGIGHRVQARASDLVLIQRGGELCAFDASGSRWCQYLPGLQVGRVWVSGERVLAGLSGVLVALDLTSGALLWAAPVEGKDVERVILVSAGG